MTYREANFDGLVGPTHNYAGLSFGNVASQQHAAQPSNPKAAAQQGLAKAKLLADMGFTQGILPPHDRPDITTLRRIGFSGSDNMVLQQVAHDAPTLLNSCSSASCMWTANAATVSPSADTLDGKVHFTPANLVDRLHRSIEPAQTGRILKAIFADKQFFTHHQHLPEHSFFGDEGAANHTRLCHHYGETGVELFVYGKQANQSHTVPSHYPARQTLEACQAVARLHGLTQDNTLFMQQNPTVIDQGVFHNDVIAVGNQNVLFYHQQAFANQQADLQKLQEKMHGQLHLIEVPQDAISVNDAISTYLFNTQLLTLSDNNMVLIAPTNCEQHAGVKAYLDHLLQLDTPIRAVQYVDVKQSMQNGGGPACLRLRVELSEQELAAVNPGALLTTERYHTLMQWIDRHYRDRLTVADLADPQLLIESRTALDELSQIMQLGNIYPFQQN
ncbi:N-succinylarginine dihydrolase [Shewanella sp. NFH-SH190041]|uniref:N-succinylarginine dihydrolase n=1 Tax=Shewanella sp. NFH-SH190041 TaxID=2950245 RepID=UPI0021C336CB|nr:N-succinylarginine dihydrolase [Shewanella sp. NFH-SH190041]BDM63950.1 N-succinylarginine dihydrolase [Shewanella sp. NFH-SH190041]